MSVNWATIFNRLFEIIDGDGQCYFSGGRYIRKLRDIDPYCPDYSQYIDDRKRIGKSTSRRAYFYDILLSLDEAARHRFVTSILDDVQSAGGAKVTELRALLGGETLAPTAHVTGEVWNANRLNDFLREIDSSIAAANYDRAISLSYTCLEGFYKAFIQRHIPGRSGVTEIISMSKEVKGYLAKTLRSYPDEALSMLNHISHTVDRTRNKFSEAHFDTESDRWLAVYIRDLVNTQIRLLLHFM